MLTFTALFGIGPLTVLMIADAEASSRVYVQNMVEASGRVVRKVRTAPVFDDAQERVMYGYERYVYTPSEDGSAPKVLFTHLLKAGGTRVEALLGQVMHLDPSYIKQSFGASLSPSTKPLDLSDLTKEDLTGVPSETHAQYFRIGMVRNPCNYLLSMWAFQSMMYGGSPGHGFFPRKCLNKTDPNAERTLYGRDAQAQLATEDDIARFRKWVRTSSGRKMHYQTLRAFFALHHEPTPSAPSWDDGQFVGCIGDLSEAAEERILAVLATTDLSERYECLIHTESLETEVRACMIKYAGFLTDERLRANFLAKVEKVDWARSHANPSSHGKCGDYFDNGTAAFVWKREQAVATKGAYETCCAI